MKKWLETISNIAILVVALLIIFSFVKTKVFSSHSAERTPLIAGTQLTGLSAYDWSKHDQTLVLVLQKGCRFCENSAPFYRQLAEMERQQQLKAHVVAVFPNEAAQVETVLHEQQLQFETIPNISLKSLNVIGTPTAILSDQKGRVVKSWIGQLPLDLQQEVIATIRR